MGRTKQGEEARKGYCHCQGCGHEHKEADMVKVCVMCLQTKFIPRLAWLEVGFIDGVSQEQWWNHIKELRTESLTKLISEKQERYLLKRAWEIEDEEMDDSYYSKGLAEL